VIVGRANNLKCVARTWILSTSLSIIFGAIIAKSFRIYQVFDNVRLPFASVRTDKVLSAVGGTVLVSSVILGAFTGVSPLEGKSVYSETSNMDLLVILFFDISEKEWCLTVHHICRSVSPATNKEGCSLCGRSWDGAIY
jgi:7 transmembrane sweet-taste receptor of 3 GCPR